MDASLTHDQAAGKPDGFRARYTLVFLACLLWVQLSGINNGPYEGRGPGIVIFLICALTLSSYFLTVIAAGVYRRYWGRVLSMLIAPAVAIGFLQAELYTGFTPDYAKLLLARSAYMDQLRQAKGDDATFSAWLWEQTWGVGITQTRTILIYDETDQILLPPEARSADWVNRVSKFALAEKIDLASITDPMHHSIRRENPSITKLATHFYIVNEAN